MNVIPEFKLDEGRFYNLAEAAKVVDVSPRKTRALVKAGEIPAVKFGPRSRRILGAALAQLAGGVK